MTTPTRLYRWFDADGKLLYVGISINPSFRAYEHMARSPWTQAASRMEIDPVIYEDRREAMAAEAAAIAIESPVFNIRRPPIARTERRHAGPRRDWCIGDDSRALIEAADVAIGDYLDLLKTHPDRKVALRLLDEFGDHLRKRISTCAALKGDLVRDLCDDEGASLADLAQEFGVTKSRISYLATTSRRRSA